MRRDAPETAADANICGAGMIGVETVVQTDPDDRSTVPAAGFQAGLDPLPGSLVRQCHRVPAGTSIRALLCRTGLEQVVARIEAGTLGLASHGRRAWLDDILVDGSRVEVLAPINVDAKAVRLERVARDRLRRRSRPADTP